MATGGTVGLAERIIDETHVLSFVVPEGHIAYVFNLS